MTDVRQWLDSKGLSHHADLFVENEIDGEVLFELTDDDLKELGLPLGARKKLMKAIEAGPEATNETQPTQKTTSEAERRPLTIMFVDLVGSTAMASRLDPEDVRTLMTDYQNRVAGIVTRFDGHVAKFMGDGVLCYFGWPKAQEDAAERAVRAGSEIVDAVGMSKSGNGEPLAVRVGIATGLVVVGDLVGDGAAQEEAVVGETPNLAARLQALAKPGQVVISETTRSLVGEVFDLKDLGGQSLKGIEQIVHAYLIHGERLLSSRFAARAGAGLSDMVGRDNELALIKERWEWAKAGDGQFVVLTGEAGIGKSRTTHAFIESLAGESVSRINYQCSPYHSDSSLYPAVQQLLLAAGIKPHDSNDEKLDKLEEILVTNEVAPFAALLGLDFEARYGALNLSPQQQRTRTLEAFVSEMEALARNRPLLVVVEDAHWIDPTLLELLDLCLDRVSRAKVLVLVTARPTFQHKFGGHPIVANLSLNRLGREQVTAVVNRIAGGKALPEVLVNEIAEKTDGVPLFVEELTKTVLESGFLEEGETAYSLKGPVSQIAIPATLHDSLMARLDRLQPIKEVAQMAACIGREFDYRLMEKISPLSPMDLQAALDQLIAAELIFRRGSVPEATFIFKHALVRDAAYESLLRSRRRANHAKIFEAIAADGNNPPELSAHHATQAGMTEEAIDHWSKAGSLALAQPALEEAIGHLNSGLGVLQSHPERSQWELRELELLVQLAQVKTIRHGYGADEANEVYEKARSLLHATDSVELWVAVYYGQWIGLYIRSQFAPLLELSDLIVREVDDRNDAVAKLMAHRMRAAALISLGRSADALEDLDVSFALYEQHNTIEFAKRFPQDPGVQLNCYRHLGLMMIGEVDQALEIAEATMVRARSLNHLNTLCYAGLHQQIIAIFARNYELLGKVTAEISGVVKEHQLSMWRPFCGCFEGLLAMAKNPREGLAAFEEGLADYDMGMKLWQPAFIMEAARMMLEVGDLEKSDSLLIQAMEHVESTEERWVEAELRRLRGLWYRADNRLEEAENSLRAALDCAAKQQSHLFELRAAIHLADLLGSRGEKEEAKSILAPRLDALTAIADGPDVEEARSLLQDLSAKT